MHKYLLIILLIFCHCAQAARSFNGAYTGIGLAYSYTKVGIGADVYRAKTPYFNVIAGWGLTKEQIYYGFEGALDSDQYAKKKGGERLSKFFGLSAGVRVGRVIQENFLPYLKLGVRRDVYSLKGGTLPNDRFTAWMAVPALGVDAFVEDWFLVRSEVEYSMGFATDNSKRNISSRPKTLLVRAGALLKF